MNKSVFVLYKEVVLDYELVERRIVVFGSEGEAKRTFEEECAKESKDREDWTTEKTDNSFETYVGGWYEQDHIVIELDQTEIV